MTGGSVDNATVAALSATPARAKRLHGLEIGRGLAAFAVVLFHANILADFVGRPRHAWLEPLEHGVDFFFVLSGYIIYHAHVSDIGRPGALWHYVRKRAIRLFPLLWAVVLSYAALKVIWGTPPDPAMVLRSLLPYPDLRATLPQVVWTLRHEFLFYAVFAVLIAAPRLGIALMGAWTIAVIGQMLAGLVSRPASGTWSLLLSSYTLDFLFGIGVAMAHRRWGTRPTKLPLLVGIILLIVLLTVSHHFGWDRLSQNDYVSAPALYWTPLLGAAFALIVHGLVCIEPVIDPDRHIVGRLTLLGGASYAIYLVHTVINGMLSAALNRMPQYAAWAGSIDVIVLSTIAGVGIGITVHLWFELPVGRALNRIFVHRSHGAAERSCEK